MSNTTTHKKIQNAGIKVGRKQTSLELLSKKVLNPTNPKFDRNDFAVQINASCILGALAGGLSYVVLDAEAFCSNPTSENLALLDSSLKLLAKRVNGHLNSK